MSVKPQHYVIQGFAMVVSPGHVADCDIFFTLRGPSPRVKGIDLYRKDKTYLGWCGPENVDMGVMRAMLAYIKGHRAKWIRVYHRVAANGQVLD